MKLRYQAYDASGRSVADVIDAPNPEEATDLLRRQGLFVTTLTTGGGPRVVEHAQRRHVKSTRKLKHLAIFTRQLYVLATTGTPLVEALGALQRQAKDPSWSKVIGDLRQRVEEGAALSEAMAAHPDCFDVIYRSLVAAGETGGKFEPILDRLSRLVQKQVHARGTLIGALMYPSLLLFVASSVLVLMMAFVLPRFAGLFDTLDVPLPPTTQGLLYISDAIRGYWWAFIGGFVGLVLLVWLWSRTQQGRLTLDSLVLRLPLFGKVVRNFILARLVRLIGVLQDSYVPLLDVLDLARDAAGNAHYRRLMTRASESVTRGEPISTAFADNFLVDATVYEAIRSGESSGKLSEMLINMADFMDEENETVLRSLTSILEPVILIVLGLLVGFVALSMFLPLFDLTAMAGESG